MKRKTVTVFLVSFVFMLSILNLVFVSIFDEENAQSLVGGEGVEPLGTMEWKTLGSTWEPVVVEANQLIDLIGTPVNSTDVFSQDNDILVYIWNGSTDIWEQIPFQVDERSSINGSYLEIFANGVLEGYDEIVFMAQDAGDRASLDEWVVGCDAPRYEVEITDPDTGDNAWAYIYKSSKIEANFTEDYVRFDIGASHVYTDYYTMGFRSGKGMIIDYFNVTEAYGGDGENLVDTLEIEVFATLFSINFTYDENSIAEDFNLKKDGYVRGLGVVSLQVHEDIFGIIVDTYFNFTWKFYPEYVNATEYVTISIDGPVVVDVWLALDHISSAIPMNYRDYSGNTGIINGTDDDNIINPDAQSWWEVTSSHGGYVCIWNLNFSCSSSELKFDDNSSAPDHNNAEPGLYGRTGEKYFDITHHQLSKGNMSYFPIPANASGAAESIAHNITIPLNIITRVQHAPTIWVDKGIDVASAKEGDIVNYTIFFNNTGDLNANSVWINDTLPNEVTFVDHDADTSPLSAPFFVGFTQVGSNLYFEFDNVPPGIHYFSVWGTVNTNATAGQTVTNWVYCNFTNPLFENMPESGDSASFEVLGAAKPDILVEKSVNKVIALPGEILQYTIYFNNTGFGAAESVWINDSLSADVTYLNDSSATELGVKTGDYNWTFTNVAPGDHSFVINVSIGSVPGGSSIYNAVFLNYTTPGGVEMPGSQAWIVTNIGSYIILKQGWNLISISKIQQEQDLTKVLASIDGLYDAVQWYDIRDDNDPWKHCKVGKPYGNDLNKINETMGFWIHITQPGDTFFMYKGLQPTMNQTINLYPGWNLVGYPSLTSYNRTDGLNNLTFNTDVNSIWSYNATTQKWEEMGPTDYFKIGRGYWVHSLVTKTWIVPL